MAYNKTVWVNNETPINTDNLNNIEDGIEDVDSRLEDIEDKNPIYFTEEEEWEE